MSEIRCPADGLGRVLDEKLAEETQGQSSANRLRVDTESGEVSHNRGTPDGQMRETAARFQRFTMRTLPPWIRSVEVEEEKQEDMATDRLLPSQPDDALVAQHNHSPHASSKHKYSQSGDQSLLAEEHASTLHRESRWKSFSQPSQYPREAGREDKQVTAEWMNENWGNYSEPWRGKLLEGDPREYPLYTPIRRKYWFERFHTSLLSSPIVPMVLRLTVWCFSLSALALGGSIQQLADKTQRPQGPSPLMAIIVDAVALVYLIYITFDEYSSKPLGLRSPSAKARLILLDLFFIVFDSANLSLAFVSLSEVTRACTNAEINREIEPRIDVICVRQKALASVLLVALLGWLMTFAISVLRLVERVTS